MSESTGTELAECKPENACPNCGAAVYGQWCYNCGQNQKSIHRYFFALVGDLLEDVFAWNSRTGRTLFALLFRPGYLALEFFAGRRARYLPPLRLYLIASFTFFFCLSIQNMVSDAPAIQIGASDQVTINRTDIDSAAATESMEKWEEEVNAANIDFTASWLPDEQARRLEARVQTQLEKLKRMAIEDRPALVDTLLSVSPPAIFLLLPLFALLLKIFYFSFNFYYIEHLILAITNHSFLFVFLTIETVGSSLLIGIWGVDSLAAAIFLWIPVYLYLSLKFVYGQGHFATLINFILLGSSYLILLFCAIAAAFVFGVMTL